MNLATLVQHCLSRLFREQPVPQSAGGVSDRLRPWRTCQTGVEYSRRKNQNSGIIWEHLPRKCGEKNQKIGNILATKHMSINMTFQVTLKCKKKLRNISRNLSRYRQEDRGISQRKNQKSGNLMATLVHQPTHNQPLIKCAD